MGNDEHPFYKFMFYSLPHLTPALKKNALYLALVSLQPDSQHPPVAIGQLDPFMY